MHMLSAFSRDRTVGKPGEKKKKDGFSSGWVGLSALRCRPLVKLWGWGLGGEFLSRRNFFLYQIPCMNYFLGRSMNIFYG